MYARTDFTLLTWIVQRVGKSRRKLFPPAGLRKESNLIVLISSLTVHVVGITMHVHYLLFCMSLTCTCKPNLPPDIFNVSIIWHSANHWYVRNVGSWCFRMFRGGRWRRAIAAHRSTVFYRAVQRSNTLALFNGTDKRVSSLCFNI